MGIENFRTKTGAATNVLNDNLAGSNTIKGMYILQASNSIPSTITLNTFVHRKRLNNDNCRMVIKKKTGNNLNVHQVKNKVL